MAPWYSFAQDFSVAALDSEYEQSPVVVYQPWCDLVPPLCLWPQLPLLPLTHWTLPPGPLCSSLNLPAMLWSPGSSQFAGTLPQDIHTSSLLPHLGLWPNITLSRGHPLSTLPKIESHPLSTVCLSPCILTTTWCLFIIIVYMPH